MNEKKTEAQKMTTEASNCFEIKEDGFAKYRDLMLKSQRMPFGILGGLGASLVGNAVWIGILLLGYKIDFLVLCVGFFIGYSIRYFGKAIEPKFGYVAGAIAFVGTVAAYFIIGCILFVKVNHIAFFSVFAHMNFSMALFLMWKTLGHFLDILFCLGAVGIAYYFAFKPLKEF
jgi:hypothetical protein